MVLVSVAMLSYNHDRYLAEAIESVLGQTVQDLELIIVDDCSKDKSKQIIDRYQAEDARVRPFFHERNLGISKGANDCLKNATGKYLGFIGSDDAWLPNKLEKQLKVIEKNQDKVVWSEGQIIDGNGDLTGETATGRLGGPPKKSGNLFQDLLTEDFIFGQSILLRTNIAQKFAFNENLRYVNDHQFFIELSKEHEFVFMPEALAKYRVHGQNITDQNRMTWFKERIMLRNKLLKMYKNDISAQSLADIYYKLGHAYTGLGKRETARYCYTKAILVDPLRSHTPLYVILAMTNGEGTIGSALESNYKKILALSTKVFS